MPDTPSSPNRSSLLGWVKNLKRLALALNESVNTLSDTDADRSPARPLFAPPESHELLRPILNHKSRSTNNVHRHRLDSNGPSMSVDLLHLRQHRDLFLQNHALVDGNSQYFGVPLLVAISLALVKISIMAQDPLVPGMPHYGRIPIVVAKCGVFLKKNGLAVEGIFRVGGLSKRIRELQAVFNSPPEFGRKLDWDGYNVHDAASVLRRYLNALPEPLVPLELYEEFRDPLRLRTRIIKFMKYRAENPRKRTRPDPISVPTIVEPAGGEKEEEKSCGVHNLEELNSAENPAKEAAETKVEPTSAESVAPGANTSSLTVSEPGLEASDESIEATKQAEAAQPKLEATETERGTLNVDSAGAGSAQASSTAQTTGAASGAPKTYKKLATDVYAAIDDYKHLLDELPGLSRQLLFYILDLLSMVQNNSDENLMSARNLAAIFQPSILLHPNHDMDPDEYALSQLVVEFLIQYAYKLLPNDQVLAPPNSSKAEQLLSSVLPANRSHSKSLSNANHDYLDMIGYHTLVKSTRGLTVSDTEHDFGSASSDDELVSEMSYLLPKPSAAPNLMGIIHPDSLPTRH